MNERANAMLYNVYIFINIMCQYVCHGCGIYSPVKIYWVSDNH